MNYKGHGPGFASLHLERSEEGSRSSRALGVVMQEGAHHRYLLTL